MSCSGGCRELVTTDQPADVECTECGGRGCDHCDQGYYSLHECPQRYIGNEIIADLNIVDQCRDGVLPVSGGLMDQSPYYFELTAAINREVNLIKQEKARRK